MIEVRLRGVKRFQAKNKQLGVYLRTKYAPEIVKAGKVFARKIAPRDTGALLAAIKKTEGQKSGKLILVQPNHPADGTRKPYHLWMHGIRAPGYNGKGYDISRGPYAPKTGMYGPKFMFVTYEKMKMDANETFKKKLKTLY